MRDSRNAAAAHRIGFFFSASDSCRRDQSHRKVHPTHTVSGEGKLRRPAHRIIYTDALRNAMRYYRIYVIDIIDAESLTLLLKTIEMNKQIEKNCMGFSSFTHAFYSHLDQRFLIPLWC